MDLPNMVQRVAAARVGRLATVDAAGVPHLVPVCFAVTDAAVYSAVDDKPKRSTRLRRVANVEATGRACLLVDQYDEDWARLWWVRLDCRARIVAATQPEAEAALAALTGKYPQYAARPPQGPVIALDVERWSGWSAMIDRGGMES
jgi:PPOX class probable F420-dependent enzyme